MRNYFYYAPGLIIPRLVAALIMLVFARILSPQDLGLYALVLAIGEYLDTICTRWIRSGYTRLFLSFDKKGQKIDRTILLLMLPGTVFSIIFAFSYAALDADMDRSWALLLSLYVIANFGLYQGLQFLRVRGNRGTYVLLECGRALVGFGLAIILTHWIAPRYEMLVLGTQLLTLCAALFLLYRIVASSQGEQIDRAAIKEIMLYSTPLVGTFFLSGTGLILDRILLEKFMGPAALGVYAVSYQLARPAMDVLFNIINVGGFPKLIEAYETDGNNGAITVLYQKNIAIALVALPMLTFILVSAETIATLLLPADFVKDAPFIICAIAIASCLRGWLRFLFDQVFLVKKTPVDIMWNMLLAIAATIIAAVVLIPMYGVRGAALCALAGVIVELSLSLYRSRRRMTFTIFGPEVITIVICCVLGGALMWLGNDMFGISGWVCASAVTLITYAYVMKKRSILKVLGD